MKNIFCINLLRSSHPEVFLEKGVLKICSKFTGEHPFQSVISIKLLCNFIELIWIFTKKQPRLEVFCKESVLVFTRKYLCQSLFFSKVAGLLLVESNVIYQYRHSKNDCFKPRPITGFFRRVHFSIIFLSVESGQKWNAEANWHKY